MNFVEVLTDASLVLTVIVNSLVVGSIICKAYEKNSRLRLKQTSFT